MVLTSIEENTSKDLIMDLNIPFKIYFLLFLFIITYVIFKYFFSSEEIFEFIEKSKKNISENRLNEENKLNLLIKLNTKINRDYLDNSKYYNEIGYTKIYGNKKENVKEILLDDKNKIKNITGNNKSKIIIRKRKKVEFSNNIIYENDNVHE